MGCRTAAFFIGLFTTAGVVQAECRTWVFLREKAGDAAAVAALRDTYDPHAVARRMARRTEPGLFDARDLPVDGDHVAAIAGTGAQVAVESRWLNAVSVTATPEQLAAIAQLPFVTRLEPVRTGPRTVTVGAAQRITQTYAGRDIYGYASAQTLQVNLAALHAAGYTGAGVRVAVLDTGFRHDHAAFGSVEHPLVVLAEKDFINNDLNAGAEPGDPDGQFHHGTLILGVLASYQPGALVGGAFGASYILCKTENVASETPVEEDYYVAALEFAELHGADVVTSSLSYTDWYTQADMNGVTGVTSVAVNIATSNGVHCCTAAGNAGNDTDPATSRLGAPADAMQVITCGAAWESGDITWFSSDGPTADGRVKPELLARGYQTATVWYDDTTSFATASGTSLSTPVIAGVVACLTQAHPEWTPAQMRSALFATASDGAADPLFVRGYGMANAFAAAGLCGTSDYNGDGDFGTDADIEAFFACLGGNCCLTCWVGGADFNSDGDFGTDQDIESFFRVLGGGAC
jgi:subtilisin family serine protease